MLRRAPLSWDAWYLEIAKTVSTKSKDPSTKVGAVIVRDHRPLGFGYNGFPRGIADEEERWERPEKYEHVVHAELNAILNVQGSCEGATLYTTHFPCGECAKAIIQSGILRVVYGPGHMALDTRVGRNLLSESAVIVEEPIA